MDCVFCSIVSGQIPSKKVYEDTSVLAFKDLNPCAPVHILVIPKEHIYSADHITRGNSPVIAHIFEVIPRIASQEGLTDGYRVVTNCGDKAGQSVKHLHFHLIGGRDMTWPPG